MKNKLFIKCVNSFDHIDWIVFSAKGDVIDKQDNAKISDLANKVNLKDCQINLLIGTSDLVIKKVNLPKKFNANHFNKIVPNILEEDIISNIETIHFSYGKIHDSQIVVAIVTHDKLKQWLETLKISNLQPDTISPLCLSMNIKENEWQIWIENSSCMVRINAMMGFYLELDLLPTMLQNIYHNESIKPNKIILSGPDDASIRSVSFSNFPEIAQLIEYRKIDVWDAFNTQPKSINLLHDSFAKTDTVSKQHQLILHCFLLVSFILCILFGLEIKDTISYSRIQKDQTAQINEIYKSIYPEATTIVSPKQRIERDLNTLQTKTGSIFYDSLYQVGKSLNQYKALLLKSISFKNQALTITVETTNYAEIERLISDLKSNNLVVNQNKTEHQKDKLSAVLTITRNQAK